jgi:hypothetical protein
MAVEVAKTAMRGILTSSTMGLLMDADVVPSGAVCAISVVLGNRTAEARDGLWGADLPELTSQYVDDMTFCKFLDDILEVWQPDCADWFEEMFENNFLLCTEALKCRDDIAEPAGPDFVHGACLPACKNDENGTMCKAPWIIEAGFMHERVCRSLPVLTQYSYMSHWDMLVVVACVLLDWCFDRLWSVCTGHGLATVTPFDFLNAIVQMLAILSALQHAYHILWEKDGVDRPDLCGYVALATGQFFGPFMFSATNLFRIGFKAFGASASHVQHEEYRVWDCCQLCLLVPCIAAVSVAILCQMAALLTMCIAAFWGAFAYIHIFIIVCIEMGVLVGCVFFPMVLAENAKPGEEETENQARRRRAAMFSKALTTIPALYAALSPGAMLGCGAFLTYVHGDWMKLHDAFFGDFTTPALSFPNPLELLVHFGPLMEVLADMITIQFVLPSVGVQVAMCFSFLTFWCNFIWRLVAAGCCRCCRKPSDREDFDGV